MKRYSVRAENIDFINKVENLSEELNMSQNAVFKKAVIIGIEELYRKYIDKEAEKTNIELLNEIDKKLETGLRTILSENKDILIMTQITQMLVNALNNLKVEEIKENDKAKAENIEDGFYDDMPSRFNNIIKD